MTVRSDRLVHWHGAFVANVHTVLATVPAGERWILKDLVILNNTATTAGFQCSVKDSGGNRHILLSSTIVGTGSLVSPQRFGVARAGDSVTVACSGSLDNVQVAMYGARLVV